VHLGRYLEPLDLRLVIGHLGQVLRALALLLAAVAAVGLVAREPVSAGWFAALAAGSLAVGWPLSRLRRSGIGAREALVVAALSYLLFALVSAIAFLPHAPFVDGLFEAMSGFTTTGLSLMDVETLPWTLLFFRALSQWVGGAGIVVVSLVVLIGPGRAAFRLYAAEYAGENVAGSVLGTARVVLMAYGAITLGGVALLAGLGMPPADALLHGMSAVATGGFSTRTESIEAFTSPAVRGALVGLMTLGAVSFPLYYKAVRRGPRVLWADVQVRYLLGVAALGTALFVAADGFTSGTLLDNAFNAVSAASGTGFAVSAPAGWPEPMRLAASVLMAIGGATGSTTGGIKLLRLVIILHLVRWVVLRRLLPASAVVPNRFGGISVGDTEVREVFALLALYAGLVLFSGLALTFAGASMADGLFEASSAVGTVGLSTGVTTPDLAVWAKLVLVLDMWAGRLEIIPLVLLASHRWWRRNGRRRRA
jgi:trk system potassium uptake protein TrkH